MNILDLIFPKKCFGCGRGGGYLCEKCVSQNPGFAPICPICAKASIDGMTHVRCQKPYGMDGLRVLWRYREGVRSTILALKYRFAYDIALELGQLAAQELSEKCVRGNFLVPVPLYKKRRSWRGFNQSEEVGKVIAKELFWEALPAALVRIHPTNTQAGLSKPERTRNVKGVFVLGEGRGIKGSEIVLFDDVWTTGSTMREAAKVLKRAGAKRVWGLALAG